MLIHILLYYYLFQLLVLSTDQYLCTHIEIYPNLLSLTIIFTSQALHELEALRRNLDAFDVRLPVFVHLGLVHNLHQYCGIIFQVNNLQFFSEY